MNFKLEKFNFTKSTTAYIMLIQRKNAKNRRMTLARIFIDGDQGTTGLQIHARLRERSDIILQTLPRVHRKDKL